MITQLHIHNFKSWRDTTPMRFASLTGFFGANSSGKTAILQFLVMLKQTVESNDRNRVLHFGGDKQSYIDLGTFYDVVHGHQVPNELAFSLGWNRPDHQPMTLQSRVKGDKTLLETLEFSYSDANQRVSIKQLPTGKYELISAEVVNVPENLNVDSYNPHQYYGFSNPILSPWGYYQGEQSFLGIIQRIYYLGPLREYPKRFYLWSGERPQDVGTRGEWTISALLAASTETQTQVAEWLKKLGLVDSFSLRPIAEGRREYEVMVRLTPHATEVPLTDVGFGVSQILPVLVLCYYAPIKSILILEQPEIHLHPAIQANLADLLIEVIKTRQLQIILESHSEHLLRRLQRRIAEEQLLPEDVALYFTTLHQGESLLEPLQVDVYGNIHNWPENFFGDEFADLAAMTSAAMIRQGGQPMNGHQP